MNFDAPEVAAPKEPPPPPMFGSEQRKKKPQKSQQPSFLGTEALPAGANPGYGAKTLLGQ